MIRIRSGKKRDPELEKETNKSIKKMLCKKCGGVVIRSYMRYLASVSYGKRCRCKDCDCPECKRASR